MLFINTSKIRESTVGSSFTVTYSANPESVEQLKALHSTYSSVNMSEFTIKPNSSEKPNNCETCRHYTLACDLFSEICRYEPKTEPQTDIHDLTDCDFCKDRNCKDCEGGKDEPQVIACPIQEEDADYARWLYEGEPQTVDTLAIDMAVAKCKARHNNCKNCDKKCIWRGEPQIDDLIKQADSLIEFEKELLKTEPQTEREGE